MLLDPLYEVIQMQVCIHYFLIFYDFHLHLLHSTVTNSQLRPSNNCSTPCGILNFNVV